MLSVWSLHERVVVSMLFCVLLQRPQNVKLMIVSRAGHPQSSFACRGLFMLTAARNGAESFYVRLVLFWSVFFTTGHERAQSS